MNAQKKFLILNILLLSSWFSVHAHPWAYVANTDEPTVSVIDVATNRVANTIALPYFPVHNALAISSNNDTVYVGCFGSVNGTIQRIDGSTNSLILPHISLGSTTPRCIAINPKADYAYVTCDDNRVRRINMRTNRVDRVISGFENPFDIVIAPDGLTAYVCESFDSRVVPIDLTTNTFGEPVDMPDPMYMAILSSNKYAYVTSANGSLYQLDLDNPLAPVISQSRQLGLFLGDHSLQGLAITPDGFYAYVINGVNNVVSPIRISDPMSLVQEPGIAVGAQAIAIVITKDGKTAYVTNQGSNTVTVIDVLSRTARASIPVGRNPRSIAIALPDTAPPAKPSVESAGSGKR